MSDMVVDDTSINSKCIFMTISSLMYAQLVAQEAIPVSRWRESRLVEWDPLDISPAARAKGITHHLPR